MREDDDADLLPLFCGTAPAERIERVEAELIAKGSEAARHRRADTAGFVIPIAGGVASFAEEGSPLNKVAGLGFGGVPSAAALDEVERAFTACGAPVQIELAHLVDLAIGTLLTKRGYRLVSFENVLGLALKGRHEPATPPGVVVRPSGDDEFESWLDVVADDRGRRAAHRRGDRARAPPPGCPDRAVLGPACRRRSRRLRHRRHHYAAGVEVSAERAASGLRFALHPSRSGEAALSPREADLGGAVGGPAQLLRYAASRPHGGPFRDRRARLDLCSARCHRGVGASASISLSTAANRSGHSTWGKCPQSGNTDNRPLGRRSTAA
jgi:hypothetical protein